MKILFGESEHQVSVDFKKHYSAELRRAYNEVSRLLPFGSKHINFIVQPRTWGLINNTGGNAHTHNSELIELAFDPTFTDATRQKILKDVRPTIYHEMNHAARYNITIWHKTFLDNCVMEGLANVFARDYAGEKAPWAIYPKNVKDWVQEIIDKNDMFAWQEYSYNHPDGRKWIAYKVGTYLVDQAMKKSGKTVIQLTQLECQKIIELADIDVSKYSGL